MDVEAIARLYAHLRVSLYGPCRVLSRIPQTVGMFRAPARNVFGSCYTAVTLG